MPFGVELPENLGETSAPVESPQGSPEGSTPASQSLETVSESPQSEATGKTVKEMLDLDKLERFRFGEKEWTPKDLRNSLLMREDYSKKTQEVAEARKYAENFGYDLEVVLRDPSKLAQLRSVYPKSYADLAENYLKRITHGSQTSEKSEATDPYADRISKLENVLSSWEDSQRAAEVQRLDSWLDNTYQRFEKKYDDADREIVSARAELLHLRGHKIDETVLEKLFKQHDGEQKARFEKKYKSKVDEQLTTGLAGKDTGPGGGMPGSAPKGFKTLKDARNALIDSIENPKSL